MLEDKTNKMEDLNNQLSILNERNRDLDKKTREAEDILAGQENSQRLIADLEKHVADLKFQLSEKSVELQYKEKRIEETENALKDMALQSHSLDQVSCATRLTETPLTNYHYLSRFQLAILEESNRELQRKFDEQSQEVESFLVFRENSLRSKADLEREVAELKCQLMVKSVDIQYKGEQMEAMEKAIDDLTQKSENPERVIKLKRNSE